MTALSTLDLVRFAKGVWHIRRDTRTTLCSWDIPEDAQTEAGFDKRVVQFKGVQVCSRCRKQIA